DLVDLEAAIRNADGRRHGDAQGQAAIALGEFNQCRGQPRDRGRQRAIQGKVRLSNAGDQDWLEPKGRSVKALRQATRVFAPASMSCVSRSGQQALQPVSSAKARMPTKNAFGYALLVINWYLAMSSSLLSTWFSSSGMQSTGQTC
nr:hypothetical protein [Tanacetum cinerariifolium]